MIEIKVVLESTVPALEKELARLVNDGWEIIYAVSSNTVMPVIILQRNVSKRKSK